MAFRRTMIAAAGGSTVSATPVIIPYAATVTPDASAGSLFRVVATGPLTLNDPTGAADGRQLTVEVNASVGSRVLSFQGGAMDPITIPAGEWWVGRFRLAGTDWLVDDTAGTYPPVAVSSVNGDTGVVVLTAGDVGADPAGTAASAVATHSADTTAVHGIADTAALATSSSVTSAISTHAAATDPHGDRAYAAGLVSALSLADLDDVAATAPTDGQALVWDDTAGTWEPGTVAGGGGGAVASVNGRAGVVTGLAEASDLTALDARVTKLDAPTVALVDASTVAVDATDGRTHKVVVAGDRTIGKPSGGYDGQALVLTIEEDGTGGHEWTLATGYRVPDGVDITPTTLAGAKDRIAVQYDADDDVWDVLAYLPASGVVSTASKPWEFRVEDYGAKGDGRMLLDVTATASSATITSASANFTSADVGKHILINEAGPTKTQYTSGALITTIASVTNSTTAVLADAASRSVSNAETMYGTDDTAAIQAAMEALTASDNWVGGSYYCELLLEPKIYILATAPTPGGNPANQTHGNAQIPLPYQADHTKTKATIVIQGAREGDYKGLWLQTDPQPTGTVLMSMLDGTQTAGDATYGPVSVIGGPTIRSTWSDPNASNNVQVCLDGVQIMPPVNPGVIGIDFFWMTAFRLGKVSLMPFAGAVGTPSYKTDTTNDRGLGFRTNSTGLNDRCDVEHISVEGFHIGMTFDEHMAVHSCKIIHAHRGIMLTSEVASGTNRSSHGGWIGYASVEIVDYCIYSLTGGGGGLFSFNIDLLDNEGPVIEHIHDPLNALTGSINIMPTSSAELPQDTIVNGGKNLNITDMGKPRGAITSPLTTPSVPATTVALKNPFYRDAVVYVAGGTVTDIKVDGVSTGLTAGPILLPSGLEITLTYSSAPTWTWVLA